MPTATSISSNPFGLLDGSSLRVPGTEWQSFAFAACTDLAALCQTVTDQMHTIGQDPNLSATGKTSSAVRFGQKVLDAISEIANRQKKLDQSLKPFSVPQRLPTERELAKSLGVEPLYLNAVLREVRDRLYEQKQNGAGAVVNQTVLNAAKDGDVQVVLAAKGPHESLSVVSPVIIEQATKKWIEATTSTEARAIIEVANLLAFDVKTARRYVGRITGVPVNDPNPQLPQS